MTTNVIETSRMVAGRFRRLTARTRPSSFSQPARSSNRLIRSRAPKRITERRKFDDLRGFVEYVKVGIRLTQVATICRIRWWKSIRET